MSKTQSNELVSISECARQIGVARPTISRVVKNNPQLRHGTDKRPQVSVKEVEAFRNDTINPARTGTSKGQMSGETTVDTSFSEAKGARMRYESARATKAELELAREMGELTLVSEVSDAIRDATVTLHDALEVVSGIAADRIGPDHTAKQRKVIINQQIRIALEGWAHNIGSLND